MGSSPLPSDRVIAHSFKEVSPIQLLNVHKSPFSPALGIRAGPVSCTHLARKPPSTAKVSPWMKLAASEAKNTAAPPMSRG
jgi:hypothetical protein